MSFCVSEGELDTLEQKQGFSLCLRGRLCVLEHLGRCATMRNPQQMKRANGYFSVLIEEPLCILVVSQQGHIDIHMLL